jgi:hypothetical protein
MMKKIYLLALASFTVNAFAQRPHFVPAASTPQTAIQVNDRIIPSPVRAAQQPKASQTVSLGKFSKAVKVGETKNDQQTNASLYHHIKLHSGGKVSVTWTTSQDAAPYVSRGSGYNFYDGTSWLPVAQASLRIESQRTGFPEYTYNPTTNEEIILSHKVASGTGAAGGLLFNRKPGLGAGTWTSTSVLDTTASIPGILWNRAIVSGDYLIVVAAYTDSTSSTQSAHPIINGVKWPIVYSRYQFSTDTWLVKNQLMPGYDATRYYNGGGDDYSIDANGNTVAILMGGLSHDVALWKSTDNGANWTKTIVDSFKYSPMNYKVLMTDTVRTNDGAVHVMLDNTGKAHCFWPIAFVNDADTTDESISYFPGENGLLYWQEGWPSDSIKEIAYTTGADGTSRITSSELPTSWHGSSSNPIAYGNNSMTTFPNAALGSDGTIFAVYSALNVNDPTTDNKLFRGVYLVYSRDNGATWSWPPQNLTAFLPAGVERVYASVSKNTDDRLHITFLQKTAVGRYDATNNNGDQGPYDIYYMSIDTTAIFHNSTGMNEVRNDLYTVDQNFPNPFHGATAIPVNFARSADVHVKVLDLVGKEIYSNTFSHVPSGKSTINLNLDNVASGVYFYTIEAGGFKASSKMIVE